MATTIINTTWVDTSRDPMLMPRFIRLTLSTAAPVVQDCLFIIQRLFEMLALYLQTSKMREKHALVNAIAQAQLEPNQSKNKARPALLYTRQLTGRIHSIDCFAARACALPQAATSQPWP
ncbi:hypothetical protein [Aquitalea magnusonii]|uniref:hypothetical protein n=1 Tax=Aquitalea magnusonii TaxID=332411 RepID=UPI0013796830|nr:hypothetical protein [Aquitalea magnusonii]